MLLQLLLGYCYPNVIPSTRDDGSKAPSDHLYRLTQTPLVCEFKPLGVVGK